MKIPYSYKKQSFNSVLLMSVAGHVAVLLLAGSMLPRPEYAVRTGENSLDLVIIESRPEPMLVAEEKNITPAVMVSEKSEEVIEEKKKLVTAKKDSKQDRAKQTSPSISSSREEGARILAQPDYLKNPAPVYPRAAREAGWEGVSLLRVVVSKEGLPLSVYLEEGSGHDVLDQAAIRAVKQWKFKPARLGLLAVDSEVLIPVQFVLKN